MISPAGIEVSAVRLLFRRSLLYTVFGTTLGSRSNIQFPNCRYSCARTCFHARERCSSHNRESVDYIADTTLHSFVRVTACASGSTFKFVL